MKRTLLFISSLMLILGCSNTVEPKYVGSHNGRWEGYLLNQYNQGSATFTVKESGNAELVLRGKFSAIHKGKIKNNKLQNFNELDVIVLKKSMQVMNNIIIKNRIATNYMIDMFSL